MNYISRATFTCDADMITQHFVIPQFLIIERTPRKENRLVGCMENPAKRCTLIGTDLVCGIQPGRDSHI